jgi:hypothetical protein
MNSRKHCATIAPCRSCGTTHTRGHSATRRLQFRWDLYNALNHQNLGVPNGNWCLPPNADGSTDAIHVFGCQFGKITNIQTDPRSMQFGIKFSW